MDYPTLCQAIDALIHEGRLPKPAFDEGYELYSPGARARRGQGPFRIVIPGRDGPVDAYLAKLPDPAMPPVGWYLEEVY